jgi:hypothetical protein
MIQKVQKNIRYLFLLACLLIPLMASLPASAETGPFSGGSGRPGDPWLITTAAQFNEIRNNPSAHYKLMGDISVGYWTPIGNSSPVSSQFTGTLDGNSHTVTISGISKSENYVGLFGYTQGATITNLTLNTATSGAGYSGSYSYVGSIVGYAKGRLNLVNCHSNLSIIAKSYLGGLVGYGQDLQVSNSSFTGTISASGSYIGGIAGAVVRDNSTTNLAHIKQCFVTGKITSTLDYVGGIVGQIVGKVSESYTTGNIVGQDKVGGIAARIIHNGSFTSTVENCYATGDITGNGTTYGDVGGIVGYAVATSSLTHTVKNCYSTGVVYNTKGEYTGGIVGKINSTSSDYSRVEGSVAINPEIRQKSRSTTVGRIVGTNYMTGANNYALETSAVYYSIGTILTPLTAQKHGKNATLAQLKTEAFYKGIGWNFDSVWTINEASTFPTLKFQNTATVEIIQPNNFSSVLISEAAGYTFNVAFSDNSDAVKSWDWSPKQNITVEQVANAAVVKGVAPCSEVTLIVLTEFGAKASYKFEVKEDPTPVLQKAVVALEIGETLRLAGLIGLSEADAVTKADSAVLTWYSQNPAIADFNEDGKLVAKGLGLTTVTASDGQGNTASMQILVQEKPPILASEVQIEHPGVKDGEWTVDIEDGPIQLNTLILPENTTDKRVKWSVDNTELAFINSSGIINFLEPGTLTVYCKVNQVETSIILNIVSRVKQVDVSYGEDQREPITLEEKEQLQLSAIITPENASNLDTKWFSETDDVATVDSFGLITAVASGITNVYAEVDGVRSNSIKVTVPSGLLPATLADWSIITTGVDATKIYTRVGLGADSRESSLMGQGIKMTAPNPPVIVTSNWNTSGETAIVAEIQNIGYSNFKLTFQQQLREVSAPNEYRIESSLDGTNWSPIFVDGSPTYKVVAAGTTDLTPFTNIEADFSVSGISDKLYVRITAVAGLEDYVVTRNAVSKFRKIKVDGIN